MSKFGRFIATNVAWPRFGSVYRRGIALRTGCVWLAQATILIAMSNLPTLAIAFQEVELQSTASADEIFVGESIEYQVEIRNAQNPSAPDLSAIKEIFDVTELGNQSRNQSQMTIINGRFSQNTSLSHVYQYRLTPKQTGALTIPAASATIEGREIKSRELPLRVVPAEEQDVVLVEIQADQSKVYPTQPFIVTLHILVQPLPGKNSNTDPLRPLRRSPPHIEANWVEIPSGLAGNEKAQWLQPLLAQDGVGFTLNEVSARTDSLFGGTRFAVFDLSQGREIRKGLDGQSIEYFRYELSRTFTAEKTGSYRFGPAVVKGAFISGMTRDDFSAKRIVAVAPALTIEVRDVPAPRPATFCGGIGEYQWRASASPTKLRVGDPLTLTLEVERGPFCGSLDLISAPDLSMIPKFTDDFDLIDKNPTGRIEDSVKRFTYAMRPKRAEVGIPALSIATFDPRTESFIDFATGAIALDVSDASGIDSRDLVGKMPTANSIEIKTRSEGIFQNITDPSQLRDQQVRLDRLAKMAGGVWLAAGSLVALVSIYRRKSSDVRWQRRQQARRTANRRLAEARQAMSRGDSKEAMRHVRGSVLGLVADTRDRLVESLTATEVDTILSVANVSGEVRRSVMQLLDSIETAEYGAGQAADPAAAIDSAKSLIAGLAPILERGP